MVGSNIYIGSQDGHFYAFVAATGKVAWTFGSGHKIQGTPAVSADGSTLFVSGSNNVYSLSSSTGAMKWQFQTGDVVSSSAAIGPDGMVYIGSEDGNLYALTPTGSLKWKFVTKGTVCSTHQWDDAISGELVMFAVCFYF